VWGCGGGWGKGWWWEGGTGLVRTLAAYGTPPPRGEVGGGGRSNGGLQTLGQCLTAIESKLKANPSIGLSSLHVVGGIQMCVWGRGGCCLGGGRDS
jgi:hypothetical protein